jgi:hypothetical protein
MCVHTPESMKEVVHEKLRKNGVVNEIDHRIKVGMVAAIGELRGQKDGGAAFDGLGFHRPQIEIKALQRIYAFLKTVDLSWTRECVINETQVQPQDSDSDLIRLILGDDGLDEGTASDGPAHGVEEEEEEDSNYP